MNASEAISQARFFFPSYQWSGAFPLEQAWLVFSVKESDHMAFITPSNGILLRAVEQARLDEPVFRNKRKAKGAVPND